MFRIFTWISIAITWPLISFGALVRLKGAGMACPDWPLCYGRLIPPPGLEIALEVGHRFIAVLLGISIIGMFVISFRKCYPRELRWYCLAILALVIAQGIFGALTVTMSLNPLIVTFHLIGGNLLFWALVYLYVVYGSNLGKARLKRVGGKICSLGTLLFLNLLIWTILFSGGLNSTNYAGHLCDAFPLCHANDPYTLSWDQKTGFTWGIHENSIIIDDNPMPSNKLEWIHMAHRVLAIFGGLALVLIALLKIKPGGSRAWGTVRWMICGLILLEILVGILNALWKIPVPVSVLHTAIASTLVGVIAFATGLYAVEKKTHSTVSRPCV